MGYRVANSRRSRSLSSLSSAEIRLTGPVDDLYLDAAKNILETQDRIGGPVTTRDTRSVKGNLLQQSPTRGLHDRAFDLIFDTVRIDCLPAVVRRDCAAEPNVTGLAVDLKIQRDCHIRSKVFVFREGESATVIWANFAPILRRWNFLKS